MGKSEFVLKAHDGFQEIGLLFTMKILLKLKKQNTKKLEIVDKNVKFGSIGISAFTKSFFFLTYVHTCSCLFEIKDYSQSN